MDCIATGLVCIIRLSLCEFTHTFKMHQIKQLFNTYSAYLNNFIFLIKSELTNTDLKIYCKHSPD